jgi:hypothetical protein
MMNNTPDFPFLFIINPINIILFIIWIGLLIYTIILTTKVEAPLKQGDPPISQEEKIKKENEFTYVTTLFCIFTLVNYFRYFPLGWPSNSVMMTINWFAAIASLVSIFLIINKNKLDENIEKYKTKLLPLLGMLITLAVYTIHTGLLKIMASNNQTIKIKLK